MSVADAGIRWLRILGPLVVAAVGASMCAWTWGSWPDPVVDFGRELYVPWRLAEGEVLYRDFVSYFNGPLSPYAHALLFKVFGPSLRVLAIFNLVVTALLVAMLYRLIALAAGHLAATGAGVVFFTLFAFAQYLTTGNFNYVCPYSYELTHGITLTLAMITCLDLWARRGRVAWLVATGALLGLIFLTKAEVFFGAAVAVGVGFAAVSWLRRPRSARLLADIGILLGCALV